MSVLGVYTFFVALVEQFTFHVQGRIANLSCVETFDQKNMNDIN